AARCHSPGLAVVNDDASAGKILRSDAAVPGSLGFSTRRRYDIEAGMIHVRDQRHGRLAAGARGDIAAGVAVERDSFRGPAVAQKRAHEALVKRRRRQREKLGQQAKYFGVGHKKREARTACPGFPISYHNRGYGVYRTRPKVRYLMTVFIGPGFSGGSASAGIGSEPPSGVGI